MLDHIVEFKEPHQILLFGKMGKDLKVDNQFLVSKCTLLKFSVNKVPNLYKREMDFLQGSG